MIVGVFFGLIRDDVAIGVNSSVAEASVSADSLLFLCGLAWKCESASEALVKDSSETSPSGALDWDEFEAGGTG